MFRTITNDVRTVWNHTGFQKYLKNTGWAMFGKIVSLAISFVTSIYVIRHLGPGNYGMLSFSVSFVGLFSFIATLGIDSVLYRELAKDLSRKNELIGTALFLRIAASIIAVILICLSVVMISGDPLTRLLVAINSFTLFFGSFVVIGYLFQAEVKAKYQAIPLILVTLILSILKVLVIYFDKGVIYFAFVLFVEYILYAGINLFLYRYLGNALSQLSVKKDVVISLLRDSWPLMLSSAFIIVYTRIDQVMLKFITNDFNVGLYDAGVRLSEVWYFIPALIVSSLFPAIVNSQKVSVELFKRRLTKLYSLLVYMSFIVALPVTLLSHIIIDILYGPAFAASAGVLSIYVWAGVPVFLSIAINAYLLAENKTGISFFGSVVGMVTNIALNLVLIPAYGIYGAAFATLISYSLIPLSLLFFKDTRSHLLLVRDGIMYPFRWFKATPRNNL